MSTTTMTTTRQSQSIFFYLLSSFRSQTRQTMRGMADKKANTKGDKSNKGNKNKKTTTLTSAAGMGPKSSSLLLVLFFLLASHVHVASASECDSVTETVVVALMKVLKAANDNLPSASDTCVLQAVDDFNDLISAVMTLFFVLALLVCLADLGCFGAVLLSRFGTCGGGCCVGGCAVGCCSCFSIFLALLCLIVPIAVQALSWSAFWASVEDCTGLTYTDSFKACWEENAQILNQDRSGELALPVVFAVLALLAAIAVCCAAFLKPPTQTTRVVEVGVKDNQGANLNGNQVGLS